jgi:hypothetical protein
MKHVILDTKDHHGRAYALVHPAISATEWHEVMELGAAPRPGMFVHEIVHGSKTTAAKKDPPDVLDLVYAGALVLRDSIAKAAFAGADVSLEPIDIRRAHGAITKGWVYVHVKHWALTDRKASQLDLTGGPNGVLAGIKALAWTKPPHANLFRLVEAPRAIVADERLAKQIGKATKRIFPLEDVTDVEPFIYGYSKQKPFPASLEPLRALAAALENGKPSDATRKAACAHPATAVGYAMLVDRAPRADTRAAATGEVTCWYRYATALDLTIPDELGKKMLRSGFWDESNLTGEREFLASLGAAQSGPKKVATRELPRAPRAPRFDASFKDDLREDVDEMLARGLSLLSISSTTAVPEVIDALHAHVDDIRHGDAKATSKTRLALGCVLGEQLHRAFGWSWASVGGAPGLVSPTRSHSHVPFELINRVAKKGTRANTIALFFNMLAAGDLPRAKKGAALRIS